MVGLRRVVDLAGRARRERAVREAHVVVGAVERARDAAVVLVADLVGEVLPERAAAGDVHDLHAAADAEEAGCRARARARASAISNASRSGRMPLGHRVGLGAVGGRVDVGAAGQDQAVQDVEDSSGSASAGVGRQHQRDPAGGLDGVHVVAVEEVGLRVPVAPAGSLDRGADADAGGGPCPQAIRRMRPMAETVTTRRGASNGAELRIELNRPDTMNAWNEQFGLDLLRRRRGGRGRRLGPLRDHHRRGPRLLLRRRPEGRLRARRRRATRTSARALRERYHPIISDDPRDAEARAGGGQRPGGRHRLLARARLRPDPRQGVGLLPARVREHRARPRRRLLACSCPRAWATRARPRWRCWASASRR